MTRVQAEERELAWALLVATHLHADRVVNVARIVHKRKPTGLLGMTRLGSRWVDTDRGPGPRRHHYVSRPAMGWDRLGDLLIEHRLDFSASTQKSHIRKLKLSFSIDALTPRALLDALGVKQLKQRADPG